MLPLSRLPLLDELIGPLHCLVAGLYLALLPQRNRFIGKLSYQRVLVFFVRHHVVRQTCEEPFLPFTLDFLNGGPEPHTLLPGFRGGAMLTSGFQLLSPAVKHIEAGFDGPRLIVVLPALEARFFGPSGDRFEAGAIVCRIGRPLACSGEERAQALVDQ